MNTVLELIFQTPASGSLDADVVFEGLAPGWVFILSSLVATGVWLSYRFWAPALTPARRWLLIGVRSCFFLILLFLLSRPVIQLATGTPVRGVLAVLVDDSASMGIKDLRTDRLDIERHNLATGKSSAKAEDTLSRTAMLQAFANNKRWPLWSKLHEKCDLEFHVFGAEVRSIGRIDQSLDRDVSKSVFAILSNLKSDSPTTALGDALQATLATTAQLPPVGILLVTDGQSNTGSSPVDAAAVARESGVPIWIYGVGIEAPSDIMVREIRGTRGVFKNEQADFSITVRAPSHDGQTLRLLLREDGKVVGEKDMNIKGKGDNVFKMGYEPNAAGYFRISASISSAPGEVSLENNSASTRLRVLDERVNVLYVEQEPRWEFRYLLAALERDRRLRVHCLLYDGDPVPAAQEGQPFLRAFPVSKAALAGYSVLVIGDVNPSDFGEATMKAIRDWVSHLGGAVIFLAGRANNPLRYAGTPFESMLPVALSSTVDADAWKVRARDPIPLVLTPAGENSPMLRLSIDAEKNRKAWREFPGVHWTAPVAGSRAGAQVLLEDTRNHTADGFRPVVATMPFGQGTVLYFGIDETYRWRSKSGERFYSAIWNQIIQRFALERRMAISDRIQLKSEHDDYTSGDVVRVSGRVFDSEFKPLEKTAIEGSLTIKTAEGVELPTTKTMINAVDGKPGEFAVDLQTSVAGTYSLSTELDPAAIISFEVRNSAMESNDTFLDVDRLSALAEASGGQFLREEDLGKLPDLVGKKTALAPVIRKSEIAKSFYWLAVLIFLLTLEWFCRRLWNLK